MVWAMSFPLVFLKINAVSHWVFVHDFPSNLLSFLVDVGVSFPDFVFVYE